MSTTQQQLFLKAGDTNSSHPPSLFLCFFSLFYLKAQCRDVLIALLLCLSVWLNCRTLDMMVEIWQLWLFTLLTTGYDPYKKAAR